MTICYDNAMMVSVVVIKRLFNELKKKNDNNSNMRIKISMLKRMLRPHKQSSMVWIGIVLISSLILSLFLPTPIAIGIFILWAFLVYLSWILHKLIAGKQKSLHNTSYNYNHIENVVDKSCPVCGSKM